MATKEKALTKNEKHPIRAIDLVVEEVCFYNESLFRLTLGVTADSAEEIPTIEPGQFAQVEIPSVSGAFLRRPLSIYKATNQQLMLLVQVVGRGTTDLSRCHIGDRMNVLLPLGKGFSMPSKWLQKRHTSPLLVGGGVGIAPMFALSQRLQADGHSPKLLLGARSEKLLPNLEEIGQYSELLITTNDGSCGIKGLVTDHPIWEEKLDCIYCCGPTAMMKAVAKRAMKQGVPIEVSLENKMACGIGVCLCCIEPTTAGYQTTCTEGPVFDPYDLKW